MIRRALPLITGAALAAALVLTGVALWQSWQLRHLTPPGLRVPALVMTRGLEAPTRDRPWPQGVVRLHVSDARAGVFTLVVAEPPASFLSLFPGQSVPVAVRPGDPPALAFLPLRLESRRRGVLIALALALGVAAVSALIARSRWFR